MKRAIEISCPKCGAVPGVRCTGARFSEKGRQLRGGCKERKKAALRMNRLEPVYARAKEIATQLERIWRREESTRPEEAFTIRVGIGVSTASIHIQPLTREAASWLHENMFESKFWRADAHVMCTGALWWGYMDDLRQDALEATKDAQNAEGT